MDDPKEEIFEEGEEKEIGVEAAPMEGGMDHVEANELFDARDGHEERLDDGFFGHSFPSVKTGKIGKGIPSGTIAKASKMKV